MATRVVKGIVVHRMKTMFGHGIDAPSDMLRYDHCFESPQRFPGLVAFVSYRIRSHGSFKGLPTFGRWQSFSVRLDNVDVETHDRVYADMAEHPELWRTYIHNPKGGYDLVQQTYREFLDEDVR